MFKILSICKGGGYLYCRTDPPHPRATDKGVYPLHRVIAENKMMRLLEPNEVVHHIDGNKNNNDPSNICVMDWSEHSRLHANERAPDLMNLICPFCESEFQLKPHVYRLRKKRNKTGMVFCCRSCSSSYQYLINKIQTNK